MAQAFISFDANTGRVAQILAGTANSVASFSYTWDAIGNLVSRADTTQGYTENFCYDALNRLTNSAFGAACTGGKSIAYDALGNILSKSDTGTYSYPAAGQAHPHAVASIAGTVNGVANPAFAYDADGNMTGGAGRSVSWTSFNLANQVTQGTTTVGFTYDSEHNRITQTIGGASPSTTTYLNAMGSVSEKFVAGTTTTWHDYIYAAGSLVAERFCTGAAPCGGTNATMRYAVSDHLASPSSLTDGTGAVTERLSYDAWGQRRNANGTDAICGTIASATTRGFTGHEMMDSVCLVNMNARLYDPAIGRFMSADSIVPNPFDGQSFNRYAYVNDNPLNATDPSGHTSCGTGPDGIECVLVKQDGYPNGVDTGAEFRSELERGLNEGLGGSGGGERGDGPLDLAKLGVKTPTVVVTANKPPPVVFTASFLPISFNVVGGRGAGNGNPNDKRQNDFDGVCQLPDGSIHPFTFGPGNFVFVFPNNGSNTLGVGVGAAANSTAMPTLSKPGGLSGGGASGPVTSPASSAARGLTGNARFNALKPFTNTTSIGGSIGKAIPFLGTALMFFDFMQLSNAPVCTPVPSAM